MLVWDPIGVADSTEAQEEFDCLISPLMHQLHDGASERDIGKWLIQELSDHFGMTPEKNRERALAKELTNWWHSAFARPIE